MHIKSEWHDGGCSLKRKGKKPPSYVSVSCICQCELSRGGEEKKIWKNYSCRRFFTQARSSFNFKTPRFHREAGDTMLYQSFLVHAALHLSPSDNISGKTSHELENQHRHAQPLCATHYVQCPEGCSLQWHSLMGQEVCNHPPPITTTTTSCLLMVEVSLHCILRLILDILNSPSRFLLICCFEVVMLKPQSLLVTGDGEEACEDVALQQQRDTVESRLLQIAIPATPVAWASVVENTLFLGGFLRHWAWWCTEGENKRRRVVEKMTHNKERNCV